MALAVFAVVINLVPMLVEQGMSRNAAALALGLGGVGQVAGRLAYARFAARTSVTSRAVLVVAAVAVATAALALAPASAGLLVGIGMVLGLARGVYTLVQATAVTDRWGPSAYGTLNGILTAPALLASALAPFAGAALAAGARVVRRRVPRARPRGRGRRPADAGRHAAGGGRGRRH